MCSRTNCIQKRLILVGIITLNISPKCLQFYFYCGIVLCILMFELWPHVSHIYKHIFLFMYITWKNQEGRDEGSTHNFYFVLWWINFFSLVFPWGEMGSCFFDSRAEELKSQYCSPLGMGPCTFFFQVASIFMCWLMIVNLTQTKFTWEKNSNWEMISTNLASRPCRGIFLISA